MNINNPVLYPWQEDDYAALWQLYKLKDRLPHGILLHGLNGLGIDHLAAYWVQSMLCELPKNNRACNVCQSCILILGSSHPDLFNLSLNSELDDRNKTITVDRVREVIDFLTLSPHLGGYKIVFVPDMNSLNLTSANALLKILEEPPHYALFVLVSTNIGQLLPTIKSRCHKKMIALPKKYYNINEVSQPNGIHQFWQTYYDHCPLFEAQLSDNELQLFVSTLAAPSVDNIFTLTQIVDGKTIKFSFVVDFLQKWLIDIALYKITSQLNYFAYFKNQIAPIMPNLQIDKVFYLSDRLSFLQKWVNHPLNQKLQIENLMFQYQQLFVK